MFTRKTAPHVCLGLAALLLCFGLTACSDQEGPDLVGSPEVMATETNAADAFEAELDALAAQEGGEALLAELAPQIELARAELGDEMLKHRVRLFVAIQTTTFETVPPYPPPLVHLHIFYEGVATVLGPHTAFSDSYTDVTVIPAVQTTVTTFTDSHGDELACNTEGISEAGEAEGEVVFSGRAMFTGGTGRYEDASGRAWYWGDASLVSGTGRALWVGLLRLDG